MSIRQTLMASATLALMTIAGAASATPLQPVIQHHTAAVTIQFHTPAPRDLRNDRLDHRNIVSDRQVLATLRANGYRAVGQPHLIRGHLVVQARGRFGRLVTVEFNPHTGRIMGVIRL